MGGTQKIINQKMKNLTQYIFLSLSFIIARNFFAQQTDVVTIKTLGQGKTIQDATTQALREAISQASFM